MIIIMRLGKNNVFYVLNISIYMNFRGARLQYHRVALASEKIVIEFISRKS